jgi:hypothetical protein
VSAWRAQLGARIFSPGESCATAELRVSVARTSTARPPARAMWWSSSRAGERGREEPRSWSAAREVATVGLHVSTDGRRGQCGGAAVSRSGIGAPGRERVRLALGGRLPLAPLVERRAGITMACAIRGTLTKRCTRQARGGVHVSAWRDQRLSTILAHGKPALAGELSVSQAGQHCHQR